MMVTLTVFLLLILVCTRSALGLPILNWRLLSTAIERAIDGTIKGTECLLFGSGCDSKCFDDLGCVEVTHEWYHMLHRPINLMPLDRDAINTQFYINTRKNYEREHFINRNHLHLINETYFNPQHYTKIIIHGFIDTGHEAWTLEMAKALLYDGDYNVIRVDWGNGSLPLYIQATANTRLVALEVARLINYLSDHFGMNKDTFHIIGHSLGAQTAGYVGQMIAGIGRITGLDPAEPLFQHMPPKVRLDPSDANFVDVIHTNGKSILFLGYGLEQACGHLDFYPNSGLVQPGCDLTQVPLTAISNGLADAIRDLIACNHLRAVKLFTDSITSSCPYVAYECDDYDSFTRGKCFQCGEDGSSCAVMGLNAIEYQHSDREEVRLYMMTSNHSPFCLYHYHLILATSYPESASEWIIGSFTVTIYGSRGHMTTALKAEDTRIYHGRSYDFLVVSEADLGTLQSVELYWKYSYSMRDLRSVCVPFICNDHLYLAELKIALMFRPNQEEYSNITFVTQGRSLAGIPSGTAVLFVKS